jgi:hypothetical protein
MSIVGGLDIHRKQLTFDWVDELNGKWGRGRIAPANREHLADWLTQFDPTTTGPVAFAMEGCTDWRSRVSRLRGCLRPGQPHGADFLVGRLVRYFGLILGGDQDTP